MTQIEWTGITWNPVTGCDAISPGCDHCYARALAKRLKAMGLAHYQRDGDLVTSGPGFAVTTHPEALDAPVRWRKPRLVFVNSMADLFHARVPDAFIAAVFTVMAATPRHTYQVLTKRPRRMRSLLMSPGFPFQYLTTAVSQGFWGLEDALWPLPNVWLGTSIESDRYAWRADVLRDVPASVRFISAEPLLGLLPRLDLTSIDWLIVGGESGPGARPMELAWAREIVGLCRGSGTAPFVKQLGSVTGRRTGSGPKGGGWDHWPEDLKVRELPRAAGALVCAGGGQR